MFTNCKLVPKCLLMKKLFWNEWSKIPSCLLSALVSETKLNANDDDQFMAR